MTLGETLSVHPPTNYRSLLRRWYGETRDGNITRIHEIVNSACGLVTTMRQDAFLSNDEMKRKSTLRHSERMAQALSAAREGFCSLQHTYVDDSSTIVKLKLLSTRVEDFLMVHESITPNSNPSRITKERDVFRSADRVGSSISTLVPSSPEELAENEDPLEEDFTPEMSTTMDSLRACAQSDAYLTAAISDDVHAPLHHIALYEPNCERTRSHGEQQCKLNID